LPATFAPRYPHAPAQAAATAPARRALTLLLVLGLALAGLVGLSPARSEAAPARPVELRFLPSTWSASYGSTIGLHVRLLSGDTHKPLGARYVLIDVQRDGSWIGIAKLRTDIEGGAKFARRMTRTETFRARHVGDSTWAAKTTGNITVKTTATLGTKAVSEASRHYGKPYQYGAVGPDRFDCSGFTRYVYGRLGKSLPHNSGQQAGVTRRVDPSQKQVGDLIFTWTSGRISHVAIYAGNGQMWAATKTGDIVRKQSIYSRSITVGRVV
jgi:cell wall-associated NlpC family hydrolase